MRNKFRCWRLHLLNEIKIMFTRCEHCREFGASSCSIARCKKLCVPCQLWEHNRLYRVVK